MLACMHECVVWLIRLPPRLLRTYLRPGIKPKKHKKHIHSLIHSSSLSRFMNEGEDAINRAKTRFSDQLFFRSAPGDLVELWWISRCGRGHYLLISQLSRWVTDGGRLCVNLFKSLKIFKINKENYKKCVREPSFIQYFSFNFVAWALKKGL